MTYMFIAHALFNSSTLLSNNIGKEKNKINKSLYLILFFILIKSTSQYEVVPNHLKTYKKGNDMVMIKNDKEYA